MDYKMVFVVNRSLNLTPGVMTLLVSKATAGLYRKINAQVWENWTPYYIFISPLLPFSVNLGTECWIWARCVGYVVWSRWKNSHIVGWHWTAHKGKFLHNAGEGSSKPWSGPDLTLSFKFGSTDVQRYLFNGIFFYCKLWITKHRLHSAYLNLK